MGFFKKSEISKNYVMGDTLGSGNFATVKRAQYKGKEKIDSMPENVAVKIIDKSKVEDMNDIQVRVGMRRAVRAALLPARAACATVVHRRQLLAWSEAVSLGGSPPPSNPGLSLGLRDFRSARLRSCRW
mmetsp:Transcript_12135/g.38931  ORF Transcript_12135/g.38931 Transcript_12135/m.38931 type:complete len:129 (+) Transcript_12135:50-436(+)